MDTDLANIKNHEIADQPKGKYPNRFKKGVSGNPNGRPKLTDEQRETLKTIKSLAPKAVAKMKEILESPKTSVYAKIQVISIILNRTYGLPESSVKVTNTSIKMEASIACIRAMVSDLAPMEVVDEKEE